MTPETLYELATRIDEAFLVIGAAILLSELAEVLFKGSHKGRSLLEMVASASTASAPRVKRRSAPPPASAAWRRNSAATRAIKCSRLTSLLR